jgi:SAM-dependent methyltransferase
MTQNVGSSSAARWGPLFGARATAWAETWEGSAGWGTPVYEHVLDRAEIGEGTSVLDCGCGAGRFVGMAVERGARVAGIDASKELVEIAALRAPGAEFRAGDIEALPWDDDVFDVVTGFSSFQFADDKVRALREAARVSRSLIAVVVPTRARESGIASVFQPVFPLFAEGALADLKESGIFALSEPGKLDDVLTAAALTPRDDDEIECPVVFDDLHAAERAFMGAGPMQLAIAASGDTAVAAAVRGGLEPFIRPGGSIVLDGWFRAVIATSRG